MMIRGGESTSMRVSISQVSPGSRFGKIATAVLLCGSLLLSFAAGAQPEAIDLSKRGPQVGEMIPEFSLPDQHGKLWSDQTILGENGTMLVFLRSANW
jgi:hypothetical protein